MEETRGLFDQTQLVAKRQRGLFIDAIQKVQPLGHRLEWREDLENKWKIPALPRDSIFKYLVLTIYLHITLYFYHAFGVHEHSHT